jgi:hypothetical protein
MDTDTNGMFWVPNVSFQKARNFLALWDRLFIRVHPCLSVVKKQFI